METAVDVRCFELFVLVSFGVECFKVQHLPY